MWLKKQTNNSNNKTTQRRVLWGKWLGNMDPGQPSGQMNDNSWSKHRGPQEKDLYWMQRSQAQSEAGTRSQSWCGTQLTLRYPAPSSVHQPSFLLTLSVQQILYSFTHIKAKLHPSPLPTLCGCHRPSRAHMSLDTHLSHKTGVIPVFLVPSTQCVYKQDIDSC